MKKIILLLLLSFVAAVTASAQTVVNLTVQDTPDNQLWNNGTWSVKLVRGGNNPDQSTPLTATGGGSVNPQNGTLSGSGTASMSLPANANVAPANSSWQFTICPQASAGCFQQNVTVSTSSPQTLNLNPPSIRINLVTATPPVAAYSTGEISTAVIGSTFTLIGTGFQICTAVTGSTCTTWAGGGGTSVGWQNQGSNIGTPTTVNCTTNLTCSFAGGTVTIVATSSVPTAFSSITAGTNSQAGTFAASGNTWDWSAATSFKLPIGAGAAPTASGIAAYDSTNNKWVFGQNGATVGFGLSSSACAANSFVNTPATSTTTASCVQPTYSNISGGTATIPNGSTATTQTGGDNSTKVATTAYVDTHFVANGTAAMGTSAIGSGACATVVTVGATGVATTDVITTGFNTDPTAITGYGASATGAVLTIYPYPTANNVNFKVCNSTAASITPSALTLNWKVSR